ncbi:conjugal transfer protein TraC, partial [Patescibacteria group bacterium]|nr:conjugal transfer protein TraC [Patescibacteria group bacterium]
MNQDSDMSFDINKMGSSPAPEPKQKLVTPEQQKIEEQKRVLEEQKTYRKGTITIRDLIAPSSFEVKPDFLQLGSKYVRTLFIVTYPRYVGVGWGSPIINYNGTIDVSMFFYPVKSEVILKQLKNRVGIVEAQIISDNEKGAPRDPIRETALQDMEQLRDDLTQGIEHFFQFAFYITIFADDKEELDRRTNEIESIFGSKLIYTKRGFYQSEQG